MQRVVFLRSLSRRTLNGQPALPPQRLSIQTEDKKADGLVKEAVVVFSWTFILKDQSVV